MSENNNNSNINDYHGPLRERAVIDERDFDKLEDDIGYKFNDRLILEEALTHSSFAHEQGLFYDNERLEFLGDAVLNFVTARALFRMYPDYGEGELTNMRSELVRSEALFKRAEILRVPYLLLHGRSMKSENLPHSICADAVEAIIGAVCVDGGVTSAERVIKKLFLSDIEEQEAGLDPKSRLQIWLQARGFPLPVYELVRVTGPSHKPSFEVRLRMNGFEHLATEGTRKGAEAAVAGLILKDLKEQELKDMIKAAKAKQEKEREQAAREQSEQP